MQANTCWDVSQAFTATGKRKCLNNSERIRILAEADHITPPYRALCYVLAFTGCRISEALALTRDQLDRSDSGWHLIFRTLKRRRTVFRAVPIPDHVAALLLALPVESEGHFWTMHRITAWRHLKAMMCRIGIRGPMATTKGLRHGFGILAVSKNIPLNIIQHWMGHASPRTTSIYLDAVGAEERSFASRMW